MADQRIDTTTTRVRPRGAALAAVVASAATVVPRRYQFSSFIAVNPLAGKEHEEFERAADNAEAEMGAPATLPIEMLRARVQAVEDPRSVVMAALHERHGDRIFEPVGPALPGQSVGSVLTLDLLYSTLTEDHAAPPRTVAAVIDEARGTSFAAVIDEEVARWCARFSDEHSLLRGDELGLYGLVRSMLVVDWRLPRGVRSVLEHLPADTLDALGVILDRFAIDTVALKPLFEACLLALPGWAGHLQLRSDGGQRGLVELITTRLALELAWIAGEPAMSVIDPGAVGSLLASAASASAADAAEEVDRSSVVCAVLGETTQEARDAATQVLQLVSHSESKWVLQRALEISYRSQLIESLANPGAEPSAPIAQVVCCIDPRSEGMRRKLEDAAPIATYGFAGFFAMAVSYVGIEGGAPSAQCPVIVSPAAGVVERPLPAGVERAARHIRRARRRAASTEAVAAIRHNPATSLFGAELFGWGAGPQALFASWRSRARAASSKKPVEVTVEPDASLSEANQVLLAKVLLSVTGVSNAFTPLVAFVGHGSTTTNNPYRSALDCGACGGHRGAPNARIAAAVCNRPAVREALRAEGIDIPETTWFIAAEHDTATDIVTVADQHLIPVEHADDLRVLEAAFSAASLSLAGERNATLALDTTTSKMSQRQASRRSQNWAEVVPEWGLAGNAAMLIAPRAASYRVDLARRVFLHSYDPVSDAGGDALETILTAPMVVAQWINCQYYFSSVAPDHFGAGTKTVHNVVGADVGVLAGAGGDLRVGLPWQSVGVGTALAHEPLRLAVLIEAPLDRIDAVISRNRILRDLTKNGWVAVSARATVEGPWHHRTRRGEWLADADKKEEK